MNWFHKWLPTIVAALLVLTNIGLGARWTAQMEERLRVVEKHANSETVHMPLKDKVEFFVTRREWTKDSDEIKETLRSMEAKIDYLYRHAQTKEL